MRNDLLWPLEESEARLLILRSIFSKNKKYIQGRTKLAKLDFFLRYPKFLNEALKVIGIPVEEELETDDIETKMIRYRYGPWDHSYYQLLGRLIGKQLIRLVPHSQGLGYQSTETGDSVASSILEYDEWQVILNRIKIIKRHFNKSGNYLKKFIYANFPEITSASWGDKI